jgi:hypothetical protein
MTDDDSRALRKAARMDKRELFRAARNLPRLADLAPKIAALLNHDPVLIQSFVGGLMASVEPELSSEPDEDSHGKHH